MRSTTNDGAGRPVVAGDGHAPSPCGDAPRLLSCRALLGANVHHAASVVAMDVALGALAEGPLGDPRRTAAFAALFPDLNELGNDHPPWDDLGRRIRDGLVLDGGEVVLAAVCSLEMRVRDRLRVLDDFAFGDVIEYLATPGRAAAGRAATDQRRIVWECFRAPLSRLIGRTAFLGVCAMLGSESAAAEFSARTRLLDSHAERRRLTYSTALLRRAALQDGLPVHKATGQVLEIGQGRHRRVFNSSITPGTDVGPSLLALDKGRTVGRLRAAGVPVPSGIVVHSRAAGKRAAEKLGYPLVVKPLQSHSGLGVSVDLRSEAEIEAALDAAAAYGPAMVIERFVAGAEHRLLVVGSRLSAAVRRDFPRVVGNGRDDVATLIERLNADPTRRGQRLHRVTITSEVERTLSHVGLTLASIPEAGREVALTKISNVSRGGVPFDVTDQVHPDNADLAVRAAAAIDLDVAGVDLITNDISRSWRDVPAAVIEVNARPGIHIHYWPAVGVQRDVAREVLGLYFQNGAPAHLPTFVVGGDRGIAAVARRLAENLSQAGQRIGVALGPRAYLDGSAIEVPETWSLAAPHVLLGEPHLDALVMTASLRRAARRGLLIERCDTAAILPRRYDEDAAQFDAGLDILIRATRGLVVVSADDGPRLVDQGRVAAHRLVLVSGGIDDPGTQRWIAAGGAAVSRSWRVGGPVAEFHRGGRLAAVIPLPSLAQARRSQIEAAMYAFALLRAVETDADAACVGAA